ncbi:hypothetical protein TorRG33x02_073550 [Trema orientale]|uniref:Uncharacterized protein n=1 Tax=Trema orientale TaxID=63057 RepID=A0A2P5FGT2_TREOI|nr:hypothetical protein TorRG33x02_073550 [Trema orientale]
MVSTSLPQGRLKPLRSFIKPRKRAIIGKCPLGQSMCHSITHPRGINNLTVRAQSGTEELRGLWERKVPLQELDSKKSTNSFGHVLCDNSFSSLNPARFSTSFTSVVYSDADLLLRSGFRTWQTLVRYEYFTLIV